MEQREVACITGTGSGIGYALAKAFLERTTMHVVAVTRRAKTMSVLSSSFAERLHIVEIDICSDDGPAQVKAAVEDIGRLRVLIHNAGTLVFKPMTEITDAELRGVYEVNVFAPFRLTRALLPCMDGTHIINISSVGGVQGSMKFGGLSAYSSSKAALCCLTEMWSEEFKDTGNTFNCLALGSVDTEMFRMAFPGFKASADVETLSKYVVNFALEAPLVMRGKIISLSLTNP
jgi:NAD(P)-dependent dehydrogenase (short-subunit alcohol dehydrogenase family)